MSGIITQLTSLFRYMRPQDYLDIIIVAYVIYQLIRLVRETRAVQLIKGILILLVAFQLSSFFGLHMINYILVNTLQVGLIALIVVFQPELRRGLERIGRSKFGNFFSTDVPDSPEEIEKISNSVSSAAENLSSNKVGALIVIERSTKIGDIIRTGVSLDSNLCAELLINIFVPNTPLHDGAVVIRGTRIVAAACFLPLTQNHELSLELGTRHRAAIGISEASDALVVIVSEETGKISIATEGTITRNLTPDSLKRALTRLLSKEEIKKPKPIIDFLKGAYKK